MTDPRSLRLAAAIGRTTGCSVLSEFYSARISAGRGRQRIERLPYAVDAAVQRLAGTRHLVLAGAAEPVAFFAYPGKPSVLAPEGCDTQLLAEASADVPAVLYALAEALAVDESTLPEVAAAPPVDLSRASGPLTADFVGQAVAALLPEDAIVVDEAISSGRNFAGLFTHAAPHDWLAVMGGAIGFGLPAAVGAAIGAPGRTVVALEGDGSGMYTLQALWTMARENLPVVVVVFANGAYRILQGELAGVGATISGPKARDMLTLDRPALDWVALAKGMGMEARRADTMGDFHVALARAIASRGPALVEAVV
jgi:acetolactate synthase-1/2/3 large subunit